MSEYDYLKSPTADKVSKVVDKEKRAFLLGLLTGANLLQKYEKIYAETPDNVAYIPTFEKIRQDIISYFAICAENLLEDDIDGIIRNESCDIKELAEWVQNY